MMACVQEAAKGGSVHVLQLEHVQLRSQLEEEERDRRSAQEATASQLRTLQERLDAAGQDARSSLQALDSDMCSLRTNAERQLGAQAAGIEQAKARLLQCAQAIEKQWSTSKVQQQRLESLSSSGALQTQQLQERVEVINKQQTRWRASLEDAAKATAADVQLVQGQCRALENAVGSAKADARRLVGEHETETQVRGPPRIIPASVGPLLFLTLPRPRTSVQRQCDTLGRAIHSLAVCNNPQLALAGLVNRPP